MGETGRLAEDVRKQNEADEGALDEGRTRRDGSLEVCRSFPGALRTFRSGSLATGVVNHPVLDADGGVVLDRRFYPTLGPDGDGESPVDVVSELHELLGPCVRQTWPRATVHDMKRGVRIFMHEPLPDGQDPYVDIVVALTRRNGDGLWIPNLKAGRWDASHPEKHVELMTAGPRALRRTRARVVRLAKSWNKQYAEPALSSFNLCALGLEAITAPMPIEQALCSLFSHAAAALERDLTEDPAGVSGPIRPEQPRAVAVERLRDARDKLTEAIEHDGEPAVVHAAMHTVFWKFLPKPERDASKAVVAQLLRGGTPRLRATATGLTVAGAVKPKRSFGGSRHG